MVGVLTRLRCDWRFGAIERLSGETSHLVRDEDDPTRAWLEVPHGQGTVRGAIDLEGSPRRVRFDLPVGTLPARGAELSAAVFDEARSRLLQHADAVDCSVDRLVVVGWLEPTAQVNAMAVVDLLRLMQSLDAVTLRRLARGPVSEAGSRQCPVCCEPLSRRQGRHREDVCQSCGGSFFDVGVAGPLLLDRYGVTPGAVADARGSSGLAGACPACAQPMRPVLIDDVIGDVCGGCGGVWLDRDECSVLLP